MVFTRRSFRLIGSRHVKQPMMVELLGQTR